MKNMVLAAFALAVLPFIAHAQDLTNFYIGARAGTNWLPNSAFTTTGVASVTGFGTGQLRGTDNASFSTGWAGGGFVGYDFIGPRVEIEALYRNNKGYAKGVFPIGNLGTLSTFTPTEVRQTSLMANVYYDFFAREAFTPYVGAGGVLPSSIHASVC